MFSFGLSFLVLRLPDRQIPVRFVLHFPVLHFPVMLFGILPFSCPAFSALRCHGVSTRRCDNLHNELITRSWVTITATAVATGRRRYSDRSVNSAAYRRWRWRSSSENNARSTRMSDCQTSTLSLVTVPAADQPAELRTCLPHSVHSCSSHLPRWDIVLCFHHCMERSTTFIRKPDKFMIFFVVPTAYRLSCKWIDVAASIYQYYASSHSDVSLCSMR